VVNAQIPISSAEIGISFAEIPISLEETHKSAKEIHISLRGCYALSEAVLEHEGEEGEDVEAFDGFGKAFIIFG